MQAKWVVNTLIMTASWISVKLIDLSIISNVYETKYTFICWINYHVSQIKYLAKQIISNTNMN